MSPLLCKTAGLPWGLPPRLDLSCLKNQGSEKSQGQLSSSVLQTGHSSGDEGWEAGLALKDKGREKA